MNTLSVLKLTVNNHPGVMSHVCGLFARRAYNLEGIIALPMKQDDANTTHLWLLVNEERKLNQVIRQTEKLVDVLDIEQLDANNSPFMSVHESPTLIQ